MAQTNYSRDYGRAIRPAGVLARHEYLTRATELAGRGEKLPQSKLVDDEVMEIKSAQRQRAKLLQHIKDNLSNAALAQRFGVSVSNIEKILYLGSWTHIQ